MFLNYNRALRVQNKLFALFKAKDYQNRDIIVRGWYRRAPVPYVDMRTLINTETGEEKRCDSTRFGYVIRYIYLFIALAFMVIGFVNGI